MWKKSGTLNHSTWNKTWLNLGYSTLIYSTWVVLVNMSCCHCCCQCCLSCCFWFWFFFVFLVVIFVFVVIVVLPVFVILASLLVVPVELVDLVNRGVIIVLDFHFVSVVLAFHVVVDLFVDLVVSIPCCPLYHCFSKLNLNELTPPPIAFPFPSQPFHSN